MKIGIVSNSKICIPLLSYLSSIKAGVMLYFGKSEHADISVNELAGFCRMNNIQFYAESEKKELYNWRLMNEPDVIFIIGYAHKISVEELSGVPKGIFNITLWPAAAIQGAIAGFLAIKK